MCGVVRPDFYSFGRRLNERENLRDYYFSSESISSIRHNKSLINVTLCQKSFRGQLVDGGPRKVPFEPFTFQSPSALRIEKFFENSDHTVHSSSF